MIDTMRRKKLALHLRHLCVGVISNDDFESNVIDDITNGWLPEQYYRVKEVKNDDPVILPMLELCWGLYDDTRHHYLRGKDSLTKEGLKTIARCILFLHSDLEYEWPYMHLNNPLFRFSFKELLLTLLTLGAYYRKKSVELKQSYGEYQKFGDYGYWPFFKEAEYKEQLQHPPFLRQKSQGIVE